MTTLQSTIEHVVWARFHRADRFTPQEVLSAAESILGRKFYLDQVVAALQQMEGSGFIRFTPCEGYAFASHTEGDDAHDTSPLN